MTYSLKDDKTKLEILELNAKDLTRQAISNITGIPVSTIKDFLNKVTYQDWWNDYGPYKTGTINVSHLLEGHGPKILVLDIETAPVRANVWGLFKQNIPLGMIDQDWYILSWAAKWYEQDEVMYQDKRDSWDDEDDSELLKDIHALLDKADIVVTQNGKRFDIKKLNARFIINGMNPPSSFRQVDTLECAKRYFGFTSNKLEYMTNKLCTTYKKLKHGRFPGFELWVECLKGNQEAFSEMQEYNSFDVLSLQELYEKIRPWIKHHPNINLYYEDLTVRCTCGSVNLEHNGYWFTNLSKFDKFQCQDCGSEVRGRVNLLTPEKRQTLMGNIVA